MRAREREKGSYHQTNCRGKEHNYYFVVGRTKTAGIRFARIFKHLIRQCHIDIVRSLMKVFHQSFQRAFSLNQIQVVEEEEGNRA